MVKKYLNILAGCRPSFSLSDKLNILGFGDVYGVNELKRETQIVVSLYVSEENFKDVDVTLYSIFNQSVLADRVVLWLNNKYELSELPYNITRLIKNGLDIKFTDDKGIYTNTMSSLREFKSSIVITAEPNIVYPKEWIATLYHSYITNPFNIHVHKALNVNIEDAQIKPIKTWNFYAKEEEVSVLYFPVFSGGILYPPKCFISEFFREDIFRNKLNIQPEVWIWFMTLISGKKIRLVKNHKKIFSCVNLFKMLQEECKFIKNNSVYDKNITDLMKYYQSNINGKLNIG